ncbi:hypothetical protein O1L55_20750 [Streptomyces albulus]|nr:hypothetical protein [Streptomyces noursei]
MTLTDKIDPTPLQSFKCWFQDGTRYPGQHFRLMLEGIVGDANSPVNDGDLQVSATQTDLTVKVGKGRAWIYGTASYGGVYLAEVTDEFPVKFTEVAAGKKRCDLLCLQVIDPDVQTGDSHSLGYVVIQGAESDTGDKPIVPEEQKVALLPLAYVHLDEAGTIDSQDIDDVRFTTDSKLNLTNTTATSLASASPKPRDSSWLALIPIGSAKADTAAPPQVRQVGNVVYVRGALSGITLSDQRAFKLPDGIDPPLYPTRVAVATGNHGGVSVVRLDLNTDGNASIAQDTHVDLAGWVQVNFDYRTD